MLNRIRRTGVFFAAVLLAGCSFAPVEGSPDAIAELNRGDFGTPISEPSFESIRQSLTDETLKQIRAYMVDPRSTEISSIQTANFNKCVANSADDSERAGPHSLKGYCFTYGYNSKNRMGGYGGERLNVGFFRLERDGRLSVLAPIAGSESFAKYGYPFTTQTDVWEFIYSSETFY